MPNTHVTGLHYTEGRKVLTITYQGGSIVEYSPIESEQISKMVQKIIRDPDIVGLVRAGNGRK